MPAPDYFALSRRQLRSARIQDALSIDRGNVDVLAHRNRLLEPLAIESTNSSGHFDQLASIFRAAWLDRREPVLAGF
jgi:hypothetical protein